MKRLLSVVLVTVMCVSFTTETFAAYNDIQTDDGCYEAALRLQEFDVISGYSDGTFRPDEGITRAEFTKVVVCMLGKEKEAKALSSAPAFSDITAGNWASTYINFAVQNDILSGYSDGTFGPDKNISFSEALTILLRAIGYTEEEVGYFWPNNYIDAAALLEISDGMNYAPSDAITRGDAAILTDRVLFAKPPKAMQSGKDTFIETLGYTILEDALILENDTKNNNISILSGNLKLGNVGTYVGKTQMEIVEGEVYERVAIDKDGYVVAVCKYDDENGGTISEKGIVNRLTGSTIEYTMADGKKASFKADDSFVMYRNNSKMTFATAKNYITNDTDITFYGKEDGIWNIAVIGINDEIDPVLASRNYTEDDVVLEGITINKENLVVYRDGKSATLGDIEAYDAVYYNTKTNTMDVYSKKVTGIYYDAKPSKAYVESVTVGGKDYEIGNGDVTSFLNASTGAYEIGDRITLILGKNDKIVFVTESVSGIDYFSYGVIISSELRTATSGENEGNTEFVTKMFMANGEIQDIITDKLYKDDAGELKSITYTNGIATLKSVAKHSFAGYTGILDAENRTIGNKYLLKDAVIIQRLSDEDASVAQCELIDFDKLEAIEIDEGNIINMVTTNAFGDVAILYVKNLKKSYTYGVITGFERNKLNEVTGYKIFANGSVATYPAQNIAGINTAVGAGVGFYQENGMLKQIVALIQIDSAKKVGAVEGGRIMINGKIYKMEPEVFIADITSKTNIRTITIDELKNLKNIKTIDIYSDKSASNGGTVKVITVITEE